MRAKAWTATVLVLGLGWACDHTSEPAPVPSPSPTIVNGVPVIIVPASPRPVPSPTPVPGFPGSMFAIVLATPPERSTIDLTPGFVGAMRRPILDFEFRYPQNLTLDDDFTNIEIALLGGLGNDGATCLWTDLSHSLRLDRDDKVYVANSVARFRTGNWRLTFGSYCSRFFSSSFTTSRVLFTLTPDVSQPRESFTVIPMVWTFVAR
jgi:hypothetical protein